MFSVSHTLTVPPVVQTPLPLRRTRADSLCEQASAVGVPPGWRGETVIFPAIASAFQGVGKLDLVRGNRPGWSGPAPDDPQLGRIRDQVNHSMWQWNASRMSPPECQIALAQASWSNYDGSIGLPAYCYENAALCFGRLLDAGVNPEHVRIVEFGDRDCRRTHVAILYSEAMNELSSNTPLNAADRGGSLDVGMPVEDLVLFLTNRAGTSLLIDPWAEAKLCFFSDLPDSLVPGQVLDPLYIEELRRSFSNVPDNLELQCAIHERLLTHLVACEVTQLTEIKSVHYYSGSDGQ